MRSQAKRARLILLAIGLACGPLACAGSDDAAERPDAAAARPDGAVVARDAGLTQRDSASAARDSAAAPAGHTELAKGVPHFPGKADPKTNCIGCHGTSLRGDTGPSCYRCHNNNDHTLERGANKIKHRSGSGSACSACHGPNNSGGLGPACATCH